MDAAFYRRFYRSLYRIRRVEEEVARAYPTDKIKSPVHLSIGQEAVAVAVCEALKPEDVIFISYRSHAGYLAKNGNLNAMIAELYGKATGCAKGKGGSMHLADVAHGVMGASAVVGTTIPHAVGYAYAQKIRHTNLITTTFFGDGATDEGVFYESLNFAALKELPLLFICENNGYAIHTHQRLRQANPDITGRVKTYGIKAERLPDDVLLIHERVQAAVDAMRAGESGPYFFECMMYRWKEHVGPNEDYQLGYRTRDDAAPWIANDQVKRIGQLLSPAEREDVEVMVEDEIKIAFQFAEESPFPDEAELFTEIFYES